MRFFIFFITALTFVISANASTHEKRELSYGFQNCKQDITRHIQEKTIVDATSRVKNAKSDTDLRRSPQFSSYSTKKVTGTILYCCDHAVPNLRGEDFNEVPNVLSSIINDYI